MHLCRTTCCLDPTHTTTGPGHPGRVVRMFLRASGGIYSKPRVHPSLDGLYSSDRHNDPTGPSPSLDEREKVTDTLFNFRMQDTKDDKELLV